MLASQIYYKVHEDGVLILIKDGMFKAITGFRIGLIPVGIEVSLARALSVLYSYKIRFHILLKDAKEPGQTRNSIAIYFLVEAQQKQGVFFKRNEEQVLQKVVEFKAIAGSVLKSVLHHVKLVDLTSEDLKKLVARVTGESE